MNKSKTPGKSPTFWQRIVNFLKTTPPNQPHQAPAPPPKGIPPLLAMFYFGIFTDEPSPDPFDFEEDSEDNDWDEE